MERQRLTKIRSQIFERGLTQREVASQAGIQESIMSLIVHGIYNPTSEQREAIARVLGASPEELFTRHNDGAQANA